MGHGATERMQVVLHRGWTRKIRGAAFQSDQGVIAARWCAVRACCLLREAASWPVGHLSARVCVYLWIVCGCGSLGTSVGPAQAAWRDHAPFDPVGHHQGGGKKTRRAYLPVCVSGEGKFLGAVSCKLVPMIVSDYGTRKAREGTHKPESSG